MPFPPNVRDQALVSATRHCCVCRRYKGVKVEVHHIIPEAEGGPNNLDNAITLCFDCHADAGHYNPAHPRGTKFSPSELRKHREAWHTVVRERAIGTAAPADALYCRYLVCKSFESFREVTLGELSHLPVDRALLVTNSVRAFHRRLVEAHRVGYRHEQAWGDHFDTREAYTGTHPGVKLLRRSEHESYPYFEAVRTPSVEELRQRVAPVDAVTRMLLEAGVPPRDVSLALAYEEVCGENRFQEIYRLRPLWALYLAATNLRTTPVKLESLLCQSDGPPDLGYRQLELLPSAVASEHRLPAAGLPAGATAVIPIATLLGPVEHMNFETMSSDVAYLRSGQGQTVAHENLSAAHEQAALIGPALWPQVIRFSDEGTSAQQELHEFDLSNLYTVDRSWEAGSCPHLFAYESEPGEPRYLGELFARRPGVTQSHRLECGLTLRTLVIAELEPETTFIDAFLVNGRVHAAGIVLHRGESLRIRAKPGDAVEIIGRYEAPTASPLEPWRRNYIVQHYIATAT